MIAQNQVAMRARNCAKLTWFSNKNNNALYKSATTRHDLQQSSVIYTTSIVLALDSKGLRMKILSV